MKRSKISDVAKLAGVSASTISNFLNGRYDNMSYETRKRIEEAVAALNYTPNISARRLSAKEKCGVVCLIIPVNIANFFGSFYYPIVLSEVGRASVEVDYNILIYIRGGKDPAKEIEYLKGMYGTIADGFLLFDLSNDDLYFREFDGAAIPYVCVGKLHGLEDYHYVATDHEQAVVDAVDHLAALGHRKIALVEEKGNGVVPRVRREGYKRAMAANGCPLEPRYIAHPRLYPDGSENRAAIEELLLQKDPPTAVINSISYAQDIEQICKSEGRRIPGDLSMVVLDYLEGYNLPGKSYTHSRNIAQRVARQAFFDLLERIRSPETEYRSQLLAVELEPGDSTAPPK